MSGEDPDDVRTFEDASVEGRPASGAGASDLRKTSSEAPGNEGERQARVAAIFERTVDLEAAFFDIAYQ